jgi:hypothetical protein
MGLRTIAYLAILFSALLVLALGGWIVKGAKVITGRTGESSLRPQCA